MVGTVLCNARNQLANGALISEAHVVADGQRAVRCGGYQCVSVGRRGLFSNRKVMSVAENSSIEWTTHTFNPWVGCTKVSPGCDHCYAEGWAKRSGLVTWGADRRRTSAANWRKPLKWNMAVRDTDLRPRVFCASLADVFDNEVPPTWRTDLFRLIYQTPNLDWLLLTKRIGNASKAMTILGDEYLPDNVWLGITVVNQEEFNRDVPKLLQAPAKVRFLSVEPMLGPLEFGGLGSLEGLHWVICGGESGHKARPMELNWAIRLRQQCEARGIAFFMKQGSQANWDDYKDFETFYPAIRVREFPPHPSDSPLL